MEEFFQLFFSNEAIGFAEDFHTKCGDDGMILFLINTTRRASDWSKQFAFGMNGRMMRIKEKQVNTCIEGSASTLVFY